ncbi:MAG: aspartate aminotransferase family protein [Cytophagales bacterium]|nr:MAG: aspartate aminotransferase family protein [Cytophagales bacterium]
MSLSQRQLFLAHVAQTSDFPLALEIESAKGVWMYSKQKKYLDLISGIGVSNVGHCHPKVVEAIQNQAAKFMHLMVYGEYIYSPQVKLAEKICQLLPSNLDNCYFTNSGTEATEGALKLAKRYIGRTQIIACHQSYHGSSHGALSVMGNEKFKQNYRPLLPDIEFITFGSWSDIDKITTQTACVIMEVIQGEAGVVMACESYFKLLRKKCTETETLLIFDEIQTGFGRTGKMFAFEHYNIVPDILLVAKGMGGGMPIGAFISSKKIFEVLKNNPILGHITTFGGNPVCCAAALATIETIENEDLISKVDSKGELFIDLLKHKSIKSIRQKGLMIAVEMSDFIFLKKVIDRCIENGIITDWFLHCDNSMRIAPPLVISEAEIRLSCEVIIESLDYFSNNLTLKNT